MAPINSVMRESSQPQVQNDVTSRTPATSAAGAAKAPAPIMIAGGGIVGLVMALAIEKHTGLQAEIYEQAHGYDDEVGAGMGMYANGLRVIRDISPDLLEELQANGYPYQYRRWERHDGTLVTECDERALGEKETETIHGVSCELQTLGIRRWKLQQALHKAVAKAGVSVYFNKKVETVKTPENGMTEVVFTDGSSRQTQLLIAADGGRSAIRTCQLQKMFNSNDPAAEKKEDEQMPKLDYTGVTCIMGVAENIASRQGITFPVANTTQCHGAFYPTAPTEQCFQFHFPVPAKKNDETGSCTQDSCWGNLSQKVSRDECGKLAEILEADGWDEEKFLRPLRNVTNAVRVGFCKLSPSLEKWSFPNAHGRPGTILVGDAAHPPVPYIGQGAQQGIEDAGTLALLLKKFCLDDQGNLDLQNLDYAVTVYESIRIPRVREILDNCHSWGNMQLKRAQNAAYNIVKEE